MTIVEVTAMADIAIGTGLTIPNDSAGRTIMLDCDLILRGSTRRRAANKRTEKSGEKWHA